MTSFKGIIAIAIFIIATITLWNEWHLSSTTISTNNTISVASYNVENLFDLVKSGQEYDIYEPFTHNWTRQTHSIKLEHTARVIKDINASIIGLQELESPLVLTELLATLKKNGVDYPYYAIASGEANVKQALLSTYKILSQRTILPPTPSLHSRGVLHVIVDINGIPVSLFVNHWRSKKGSESERIETAKLLMKELERYKDQEYILMGDFNSNYDEYKHSSQNTAINHELKTLSSKGKLLTKNDLINGEKGHTNLWLELPEAERFSTKFAGKNGSIDAIILPPTLFDGKNIEYIDRSFHVFKPDYLLHNGQPKRWKITKKGKGDHKGEGYSDHLPVIAHFSFVPFSLKLPLPQKQMVMTTREVQNLPDGTLNGVIQNTTVTYKNKDFAIIKDHSGVSLPLNDPLNILQQGHIIDVVIKQCSTVNNRKFGWDIALQKDNGIDRSYQRLWHSAPVIPFESPLMSWEVITHTAVIYSQGRIKYNTLSFPVSFGSKHFKPPNKSKLMIHRGVIATMERKKMILATPEDFSVMP